MQDRSKIIQLMPIDGWILKYSNEDGSIFRCRPLCVALYDDGEIAVMDVGSDGWIDRATTSENFIGIFDEREDGNG